MTGITYPAMRHSKLRVLTLVDALGVAGGGERLAMQVTMRLDPSRFERTLCVTREPAAQVPERLRSDARAELAAAGVRFLPLERRSRLSLAPWRRLIGLLRTERVDVLHAHKFGSNVWAAVVGPLAGVPVVVAHEHTWSFDGRPLRRLLDRHVVARGSDAIIAVSQADRRSMIEVERIPAGMIVVVPNGLSPAPARAGADVRAELGIAPGDPVVLAIAGLRPQKAIGVLLDAAARLRPAFPGLRVLVAGEGPERPALERRRRELGLEGTVALLGLRADVPDLLHAADVAVSCSDFEGSPLSLLEAMEAGRPVVATRVGGVPDIVLDGETGVLVEPRRPDALAGALAALLRDPVRAREMGRRGRERRRREFDLDVAVRRIEALYEELWGGARHNGS